MPAEVNATENKFALARAASINRRRGERQIRISSRLPEHTDNDRGVYGTRRLWHTRWEAVIPQCSSQKVTTSADILTRMHATIKALRRIALCFLLLLTSCKPSLKSHDEDVRLLALSTITNQTRLFDLAMTDPSPRVAAAAVRAITNQALLAQIVTSTSDFVPRAEALTLIADDNLISDWARNSGLPDLRRLAAGRTTNQVTLRHLLTHDDDPMIRLAVVSRVTDIELIKAIAVLDPDRQVRRLAQTALRAAGAAPSATDSSESERIRSVATLTESSSLLPRLSGPCDRLTQDPVEAIARLKWILCNNTIRRYFPHIAPLVTVRDTEQTYHEEAHLSNTATIKGEDVTIEVRDGDHMLAVGEWSTSFPYFYSPVGPVKVDALRLLYVILAHGFSERDLSELSRSPISELKLAAVANAASDADRMQVLLTTTDSHAAGLMLTRLVEQTNVVRVALESSLEEIRKSALFQLWDVSAAIGIGGFVSAELEKEAESAPEQVRRGRSISGIVDDAEERRNLLRDKVVALLARSKRSFVEADAAIASTRRVSADQLARRLNEYGLVNGELRVTNSPILAITNSLSHVLLYTECGKYICECETTCSDFDAFLHGTHYTGDLKFATAVNDIHGVFQDEEQAGVGDKVAIAALKLAAHGKAGAKALLEPWRYPGFEQGPNYPVCMVSAMEARKFCEWLTQMERRDGRIGRGDYYCLPAFEDWLSANGVRKSNGQPSAVLFVSDEEFILKHFAPIYPWGLQWPPPRGVVNLAGMESEGIGWGGMIEGFYDGYAWTAPVKSFAPNGYGIYDLGGNVSEICEQHRSRGRTGVVDDVWVVGGSWRSGSELGCRSYVHYTAKAGSRSSDRGFRVALVTSYL